MSNGAGAVVTDRCTGSMRCTSETHGDVTNGYCDSPIVTYLVSVSNVSGSSVPVVLFTVM